MTSLNTHLPHQASKRVQKAMPFQYQGWTLYEEELELEPGKRRVVYLFGKRKPSLGRPTQTLPKGKKVIVYKPTGLPIIGGQCPLCGENILPESHPSGLVDWFCLSCEWDSELFECDIDAVPCGVISSMAEEECPVCHPTNSP
jgi:hypothetical protein